MLACVCQPADPTIFRKSPIPLGSAPLKIPHQGAIPKPGRTVRLNSVITSAPNSKITCKNNNVGVHDLSISRSHQNLQVQHPKTSKPHLNVEVQGLQSSKPYNIEVQGLKTNKPLPNELSNLNTSNNHQKIDNGDFQTIKPNILTVNQKGPNSLDPQTIEPHLKLKVRGIKASDVPHNIENRNPETSRSDNLEVNYLKTSKPHHNIDLKRIKPHQNLQVRDLKTSDSSSSNTSPSNSLDSTTKRKVCKKKCSKKSSLASDHLTGSTSNENDRKVCNGISSKLCNGVNKSAETSSSEKSPKKEASDKLKLPEGVQLTVSELRDMACRQQAQIDSQHQLLAAKEQRLRYLKEQELRQQRVHAESERLRRLRDRVDAQELKLRKLRALRGQVDHQKQNNISLTSDLDSIRALFNEKEKELSLAVAKVEELTRQLEELRRGRHSRDQPPPSALELDKLRRELMYRNKLNEQQNQRLNQQREALTARQEEMSAIDKRISELQDRLHRKRMLNQQLANQISATSHKAAYHQLVRLTGNAEQNNQAFRKQQQNSQPPNGLSRGNIAAVEPYNHVPLPVGHQIRNGTNGNVQENTTYHQLYQQNHHIKKDSESPPQSSIQESQDIPPSKAANLYNPRPEENDHLKEFTVSKSDPKYQTLPYNTKFTVNLLNNKVHRTDSVDGNIIESKEEPVVVTTHNGNLNIQSAHITVHSATVHSAPLSVINKNIATPLNQNDLISRKNSVECKDQNCGGLPNGGFQHLKAPSENVPYSSNSSSTSLSSNTISYQQKPISSVAPTSVHHSGVISNIYQTSSIKVQPVEPQTICSTSKQLPVPSYSSHLPTPQTPGLLPSSQNILLSPPQSTSTPLSTPEVSLDKSPKPALPPKPAIKPPPRLTHMNSEENSHPPPLPSTAPPEECSDMKPQRPQASKPIGKSYLPQPVSMSASSEMIIKARPLTIKKQPLSEQPKLRNVNSYSKVNGLAGMTRRIEMPPTFNYPEPSDTSSQYQTDMKSMGVDRVDSVSVDISKMSVDETDKSSTEGSDISKEGVKDEKPIDGVVRRCKKGNLKQTGKSNLSRRVSFDPLALLLDASLEGELELVKKTATQVTNPSAANDEGITALHNAICAGHLEIVKFLVEFGCDVNAQDSDGWTPLHCAASCNNVAMVKFLVEHGACIFATTLSDHETAAEKCEEDEEGFDGCSEYLYSVQEKLGILSNGEVYAVFDYTAQQPDELSFKAGQQLTVLRKGDENEREWWWSRQGDKEGYVPRNLLGLYPRVTRTEE